jgi:hypothetical protein
LVAFDRSAGAKPSIIILFLLPVSALFPGLHGLRGALKKSQEIPM